MALFGLVRDKCYYCKAPIEKGNEHIADVKVIGYVGTFSKKFCSEKHKLAYNNQIQNTSKGSGGSCCG